MTVHVPDNLPADPWQIVSYVVVLIGSILGSKLMGSGAKKPDQKQLDQSREDIIKDSFMDTIIELKQEVSDLKKSDESKGARIAKLEESMSWAEKYQAWLDTLELPQPPYIPFAIWLAEQLKLKESGR